MIVVIFEVHIQQENRQTYIDLASELKPILESIDGFISVERFQSLTNSDKLLSLSFFRNEHAVQQWRSQEHHRDAQTSGRTSVFKDYRLRVAGVIRDYGMNERDQAPLDSRETHNRRS